MKDELSNDFNSAGAMGHFFSLIKSTRANKDQLSSESIAQVKAALSFVHDALGLVHSNPEKVLAELNKHSQDVSSSGVDASWIETLIEERKMAKAAKNWARADEIRKEIASKNIILKDHPDGTTTWVVQG
jgi:cysteinyl-tRNA synthetase